MHSSKVLLGRGSVSTAHGQQRILKHGTPDLLTYIQKAVQTGVYRSNEEIEEMNQSLQDNPQDWKRIRWHVPRGSNIQDYPKEYQILSLNPPAPFRPRMPLKDQRKAMNKFIQDHRPTDRLARNYLARQQRTSAEPATAEAYYQRLLGANKAPKGNSAMASKSALLNKAYAVAVKQYHIMRTENLSEKDALSRVEELLKDQDLTEKTASRTTAEGLTQHHVDPSIPPKQRAEKVFPPPFKAVDRRSTNPNDDKKDEQEVQEDQDDTNLSLLYSNQQRAFEGMISWTKRLQAVPYRQWTVGASVALDHWIAKRVLGLSEETWLALLEGDSPELMGRGRDIVMARHALFPETILEEQALNANLDGPVDDDHVEDTKASTTEDLDEILRGLGDWQDSDSNAYPSSAPTLLDSGDKILQLTEQLQEWRAKQMEQPYENWANEDKQKFKTWLEDYVGSLTPDSVLDQVDMEGTRRALLSSPPQSKDDSDRFWESIRDETAAELFLQKLLSAKNVDNSGSHPFWQLEYSKQLERLVALGSIREIADEYSSENDRARFLARYGDYLLEGLELDHLVPDPQGPIRGLDIGARLRDHYGIAATDRFRLEKLAFGSDAFGTEAAQRARTLYKAWNTFKTGRAHYEEKLFQRGLLGLTYEPHHSQPREKK